MREREQSKPWHNVQIYTTARRTWSCCGWPSAYTVLNILSCFSFHFISNELGFNYMYSHTDTPVRFPSESTRKADQCPTRSLYLSCITSSTLASLCSCLGMAP
jgi:hypothetical protein